MYKNSGAKVKGLATTITTLLMVGSVLLGLVIMILTEGFVAGLIVAAFGCFTAWLSGLMLAAFGEMVENTYYLRKVIIEKFGSPDMKENETEKNERSDNEVSDDEVRDVMRRLGVGVGDAMRIAEEEKRAKTERPVNGGAFCPNCGTPRKNDGAFCGYCGTRL